MDTAPPLVPLPSTPVYSPAVLHFHLRQRLLDLSSYLPTYRAGFTTPRVPPGRERDSSAALCPLPYAPRVHATHPPRPRVRFLPGRADQRFSTCISPHSRFVAYSCVRKKRYCLGTEQHILLLFSNYRIKKRGGEGGGEGRKKEEGGRERRREEEGQEGQWYLHFIATSLTSYLPLHLAVFSSLLVLAGSPCL